ncbi:hypothetical protein M378DRAFT_882878 [Amanita muscaria Koide BX008]|uniref:Uncharacterized protein n=1 Tax=Amanita muscaria (strain Koide BX008) TaxID=946122 RepID=A0A0C2TMN8_AMAMK|nr:hypothetical protein M378DRAFT_882878 [Amanita muscaria Koide BX008]
MPTPDLHHDRLPTEALRSVRPRHPSYRVMPPSPNGFVEEQTAQIYDLPPPEPPTFLETPPSPSPQPEADQATALYYDNPADGTSFNGQPQSQSLRISYISHHTPNTRATTLNPATPQHIPSQIPSQIPSDVQETPTSVQSPVLAHPPLSNDYRKMSLNSHDATSRTDTHTTSYSMEPSFSSELSPVKRFLHILHSLPWVAGERITSDYNPGGSEKDSPKKKPMISWYRRAEDSHGNTAAVDLLSAGSPRSEGANSSAATPPKLEPRRVRRSHSHLHTQRHQHGHSRHQRHHRQHHHRHGHGRKNQRRRTATTAETDDDDDDDDVIHHVHDPSSVLPSVYPSQYTYAYPYPFPPPTAPRGPRSRPSPTYPAGYVPFQPMPPTPPPAQMPVTSPVYVFAPNGHSQENMLRDGYPVQGQHMYVLPNGYHHNHQVSMSPPPNMDSTP